MKAKFPSLKKLAGLGKAATAGNSEPIRPEPIEPTEGAAEPKPPPPLSLFFMLSHLEEDGPVRLDGMKLAVMEVMGLELDEPKFGAFAGSLNALDFPVQLLVRQHPQVFQSLRDNLEKAQPEDLPGQTRDAADSLGNLLTGLETQGGHPGPPLLRRVRARKGRRDARAAGEGRTGGFPTFRPGPAVAAAGLGPGRLAAGPGRRHRAGPGNQPPRSPRRRPPDPFAASGQVAPLIGPRLPAGADGRRSADGPGRPPGGHPGRAGGPNPGAAEGPLRVGAKPVSEPGPEPVPGGGDRPGGREPFAR